MKNTKKMGSRHAGSRKGGKNMDNMKNSANRQDILLKNQHDIVNFVNKMEKYPFHADLYCGSCVVDAKSLLGVMGFGMGKVMTLQIYGEEDIRTLPGISEYVITR